MKDDRALLTFNERGALSQLLSVEEHLQQLPPGVNNSWCVKKHSLLCCDHHLAEAINHASRIDPQLAERYRRVKDQAERVLQPSGSGALPNLGDVAKLRNAMRQAFGDPTATGKSCGCKTGRCKSSICSKDRSGMSGLGSCCDGDTPAVKAAKAGAIAAGVGWLFGASPVLSFGVGAAAQVLLGQGTGPGGRLLS